VMRSDFTSRLLRYPMSILLSKLQGVVRNSFQNCEDDGSAAYRSRAVYGKGSNVIYMSGAE
jgi:hypothetical protein